jgi:hypothetical protein
MPHKIRSIYREVINSFNNGSHILCTGGIRAIIEGVCNLKGIQDGPVEAIKKTAQGHKEEKRPSRKNSRLG